MEQFAGVGDILANLLLFGIVLYIIVRGILHRMGRVDHAPDEIESMIKYRGENSPYKTHATVTGTVKSEDVPDISFTHPDDEVDDNGPGYISLN